MRRAVRAAALTLLLALGAPVAAAQHAADIAVATVGDLTISEPFTRATPPAAKTGAGYFSITNGGSEPDRLLAVASGAAAKVELHQMRMEGDQMKMSPVEGGIAIAPGETVALAPGGLHVMFMGLQEPFIEGANVRLTLTFERAGTVDVELRVMAADARPMAH